MVLQKPGRRLRLPDARIPVDDHDPLLQLAVPDQLVCRFRDGGRDIALCASERFRLPAVLRLLLLDLEELPELFLHLRNIALVVYAPAVLAQHRLADADQRRRLRLAYVLLFQKLLQLCLKPCIICLLHHLPPCLLAAF